MESKFKRVSVDSTSMEDSNTVSMEDVIKVTFHIMQNGKPVSKQVSIKRGVFIEYNQKPKQKFAELYEMIVADKVYVSITDMANSN